MTALAETGAEAKTTFAAEVGALAGQLAKEIPSIQPESAQHATTDRVERLRELASQIGAVPASDPLLIALHITGARREGESDTRRFPTRRQATWLTTGQLPTKPVEAFHELVVQGILGYTEQLVAPAREAIEAEFRAKFEKRERELIEDVDRVTADLTRTQSDLAEALEQLETYRRLLSAPAEKAVSA
jgi:hypothetical protein